MRYVVERLRKFTGLKGTVTKEDLLKIDTIRNMKNPGELIDKFLDKFNHIPPYLVMYQGADQTIPFKESVLNPGYPKDGRKDQLKLYK